MLGLLTKFHKLRPNHFRHCYHTESNRKIFIVTIFLFSFYKAVSQQLLHSFARSFAISYSMILCGASVSCTSKVCASVKLLLLIVGNKKLRH